jgi:hypothetical protein
MSDNVGMKDPNLVVIETAKNAKISIDHHQLLSTMEVKTYTTTSFQTKLLCGGIAGICGTSLIFPLDIVKTRLQNQTSLPLEKRIYRNGLACFRSILAKEGPVGLYRGLGPNLIGVTPEKAIKLAVNDYLRDKFADYLYIRDPKYHASVTSANLPTAFAMAAGALAGFCQVIVTNPMEMVKIHMQMQGKKSSGLEMARKLGFSGLYRFTGATLLRDVPFSLIFFPLHAKFKLFMSWDEQEVPFKIVLFSGLLAGAIASFLVTPMDVVKTKLQTMAHLGNTHVSYLGISDCFSKTWQSDGLRGLFKGSLQRCLIVAPLFGITLFVYEVQQRYVARGSLTSVFPWV